MSPEDRRTAPPVIVEPEPGSIADTFRELLPNIEFQAIQGALNVLLVVGKNDAHRVLEEAKNNPRLQMDFLRDLCGVDLEDGNFEVVYQLYSLKLRHGVTLKAKLTLDDLHIPTASDLWTGANWHERECRDMFGIVFDGHPNLVPLLLPDDMTDHFPLRKDNPLAPLEEWQGTSLGPEMGRAGHIPPGSGIEVKAEGD
jgi:NADH-quinone oxidoreductase subunit C